MKRIPLFAMIFLFFLVLLGCQTTTPVTTVTTNPETGYSIEDFYAEILQYETRISSIISDGESTESVVSKGRKDSGNDSTQTITREQIQASHDNGNVDIVVDSYLDQMSTTLEWVTALREILESQEGLALEVPFHPENDPSVTYRLVLSEEGYALIDVLYGTQHMYLKLGMDGDLLDYQEFHYFYVSGTSSPKENTQLVFNYFCFVENEEAVYLSYSPNESSLQCTSIAQDEEFSIGFGAGIVEGYRDENGYILSRYDRELNARTYLGVVNDEIVSETYDVFDDHGLVYRYEDSDCTDPAIRLTVDFSTATGWDYVVVNAAGGSEVGESTGVFLADGTKIYAGQFNCTFTPITGYLGLGIDLESRDELTDEVFSLNQYGMNLDHPKATVDYFNQIDLDNFLQIKDRFHLDGLDFFAQDRHGELYEYVDRDIRNDLEGGNEEPIVTTGDVEAFQQALALFQEKLEVTPKFTMRETMTTELWSEGTKISSSISRVNIDFDLSALFFRIFVPMVNTEFIPDYIYVLDGTKGNLVEFEIDDPVARYHVLSKAATPENFLDAYEELSGEGDLSGVYSILRISETEFQLNVAPGFFSEQGVDLNTLFEQQGITGLEEAEILVSYAFSADFSGFQTSFTISGLSFQDYEVRIAMTSVTSIGSCNILSPMDQAGLFFFLPGSIEDIIFTSPVSQTYWLFDQGRQYVRMNLEAGEYSVDIGGNGITDIRILDESLRELPYEERFTAEYDGIYYLEFNCEYEQNGFIQIRPNPTPQVFNFDLEDSDGNWEGDLALENMGKVTLSIPVAAEDRLLILRPHFGENAADWLHGSLSLDGETSPTDYFSADPKWIVEPAVWRIPAETNGTITLTGSFSGELDLEYQYMTIPSASFDNTCHWEDLSISPVLLMTESSPTPRVYFTIPESGNYRLELSVENYGQKYNRTVALYKADGTCVTTNWFYIQSLAVGDYYFEIVPSGTANLLSAVVAKITKSQ